MEILYPTEEQLAQEVLPSFILQHTLNTLITHTPSSPPSRAPADAYGIRMKEFFFFFLWTIDLRDFFHLFFLCSYFVCHQSQDQVPAATHYINIKRDFFLSLYAFCMRTFMIGKVAQASFIMMLNPIFGKEKRLLRINCVAQYIPRLDKKRVAI